MLELKIQFPPRMLQHLSKMDERVKTGLTEGMKKSMFLAERYAKTEGFSAAGGDKLRVQSGRYRAGIKGTSDGLVGTLSADVEYARLHEYGGYAGRNRKVWIRERPVLRPAIKNHVDEYVKILEQHVKKELEHGTT